MSKKPASQLTAEERAFRVSQTSEARRRTRKEAEATRSAIVTDVDPFLTIAEVAALRTVSPDTIRRMIRAGKFPEGERVGARRIAWRRSVALS
jgi:predicted DNA-binding transcriptional regulator AlpA